MKLVIGTLKLDRERLTESIKIKEDRIKRLERDLDTDREEFEETKERLKQVEQAIELLCENIEEKQ